MAGGVTKGFGITFLILGGVLVLAGIVAAAYGFFLASEQQDRGFLADPDQEDLAEALLIGGGLAAGIGLLLLILGGILAAIGGGMARREMLRTIAGAAPAAAATPASTPRRRSKAWIVAAIVVGVLLLAAVFFASTDEGQPGSVFSALSSTEGSDTPAVVANKSFDGRVQGVRAPILGGLNTGSSQAVHDLAITPGVHALRGTLNWTADAATGASSLVLILEAEKDGVWEELGRGEGGPGLVVEAPPQSLPANIRARVFLAGDGAGDQAYALELLVQHTP